MSKTYTLREAKLILKNRALKKTIAILRDQLSTMRRAFLDIQEVIRNNDKDAEIERLNATIDRTVNAWESRCIEKYDEIKRLNSWLDEVIKQGNYLEHNLRLTYEHVNGHAFVHGWRDMVNHIQKEREG